MCTQVLSILLWPCCPKLSNFQSSNSQQRRRQCQPTPVLLPGKSHGWRSLVGCSPWGRWESDTTEQLHFHFSLSCIGEGNGNPVQGSCLENPGAVEPGGLPSMGSHRVGHDWSSLAAAAAAPTDLLPPPSRGKPLWSAVTAREGGGQDTTGMLQRWGSNFCTEIQLLCGYRSGAILHCELLGLLFSVTQPSSSNSEYLKLYYVRKLRNT